MNAFIRWRFSQNFADMSFCMSRNGQAQSYQAYPLLVTILLVHQQPLHQR